MKKAVRNNVGHEANATMGMGACILFSGIAVRLQCPQRIVLCDGMRLSDVKYPLPNPFKLSKIRWDVDTGTSEDINEVMIPGGARYRSVSRGFSRTSFLEIMIHGLVGLRVPLRSVALGSADFVAAPADVKMPLFIKHDQKMSCSIEFTHSPVLTQDLKLRVMLVHET